MSDLIFAFLKYFGGLILLTLGTIVICGLAVRLCARAFSCLMGSPSGAIFDITSVIGTPIHELGHAMMCPLFGHKIESMCLWSPRAENGVYGYVNHSYNRKNVWQKFGNLFIGVGPIFSGMLVMVLMLWLCFPNQWNDYLASTAGLTWGEGALGELAGNIFALFLNLPNAFKTDALRAILGLVVILPISLHISLSPQDIKGSLGAMPFYLLLLLVFAIITYAVGIGGLMVSVLWVFNLRLLSLFGVVIAFSLIWVVIGLIIRGVKTMASYF